MSHLISDEIRLFQVRQSFEKQKIDDVKQAVDQQFDKATFLPDLTGKTVAISAGSRGIANIGLIIRTLAANIRSRGGIPFIVPAMGSHGGGTAEGQRQVLANYRITEEYCECEIRASMETIEVCQANEGFPVHFDKQASLADYVLVCGRIKPHTDFTGPIQSGLMKMMLIGLGKHEGAKVYHKAIKDYTFDQIVRSVAREVIERCHVLGGLGIVENAYEETAHVELVPPHQIESREEELLEMASRYMPRLPFDMADFLVIDEIGKEISGAGLDTNIVGRKYYDHFPAEHEFPKIKRIAVRGLTEATHGNATGIGMAEFCRTSVLETMNVESTRINCLTSGHVTAGMSPIDFATDRQMIDEALNTVGFCDAKTAKMMWIKNTLHITELCCSEAYLEQATPREDLEILCEPTPLKFDTNDNLVPF
ncbi:MAG: lactate racemase domain-containing protein [Planctomycetota bacterium]|nr:lactate racemase domain-containing protein [Planctomycetota bacterium]